MGVVHESGREAAVFEEGHQFRSAEYPDMPAHGGGIPPRERPADALGPAARHTDDQMAARFQDAGGFGDGRPGVGHVFEYFRADDEIEPAGAKRQMQPIGLAHPPLPATMLAQAVVKFEPALRRHQLREGQVHADHPRTGQPIGSGGVTAAAAADVQDPAAGCEIKTVEVDGDHRRPPDTRTRFARPPGAR
jgi:hypothetical protein